MGLSNITNEEIFRSNFKLISLMAAASVTMLLSFGQTGWADFIVCSATTQACNGTAGDDIIWGAGSAINVIHGLGGNDYIIGGTPAPDYLFGDDGNDILFGTEYNDYINGGRGNDKYDGYYGDDTIVEEFWMESPLVSNDDIISGGEGNDYIVGSFGSDRIHSGPGEDLIYPNGYLRDFSLDNTNCGSGTGDRILGYSGDGDTAVSCEQITDFDS